MTVHNWLLNLGAQLILILLALLGTSSASHAGFSSPWTWSSGSPGVVWATYPILADFTSDGIRDQISSDWSEIVVLPGRGDGTFGDPIRSAIRSSWGAPALAVADFSNDGRLDVFTFDWDFHDNYSIANVLLGSANGRFSSWETLDFSTVWSGGLGTGDINLDGLTDVAIAAGHDPDTGVPFFTVLLNDGNWPTVMPALPGDFNRSGTVDAADYVVWRKTLGASRPNYSGADGNGNGVIDQDDHSVWRAHFGQTLPAGAGSLVVAAPAVPEPATAVLFGAGLVAVFGRIAHRSQLLRTRHRANRRQAVRLPRFEPLEDRCLLSFTHVASYAVASAPIGMQAGDFNGDGIVDLATASGRTVSVLLGNGDGAFHTARNTSTSYYISLQNALAVGDFNRDGKFDLATSANDSAGVGVNVLLGRGDGTFVSALPHVVLSWSSSIAAGDVNGDGKLDLVATAADYQGTTYVHLLWGNGDGTFEYSYNAAYGPAEAYSLALADFDGDNHLDLVLGGNFTTWVLLRNGDSSFQQPRDLGMVAESLTVADFNADGKPDLATTTGYSVSMLLGNGDGSFQTARSFAAAGGSVSATDLNDDGALDLVLAEGSVLLGTGHGNFGPPITTAGTGSYLVVADFNGDGHPDEALTHTNTSTTVTVLLNDGNWPGVGPTLPGDYNRSGIIDAADYVVWRKTVGSSVRNFTAADGDGNGVVDEGDHAVWRANFGQPLPMVGAGSLVAAAPAPPSTLAKPDERGTIEPPNASERDAALADPNSRWQQSIPKGNATMRRLHALPTTESVMNVRANDLLLVQSVAAEFDEHASERGRNLNWTKDSTDEVVETRREARHIAFSTLLQTWKG
jgi:hypothetical protein